MPIEDDQVVNIDLKPGQASFHHTLTLHRSGANESDEWRLGVGFNYVSSNVMPVAGHQDSAILLRGCADGTGFVLVELPRSDLDEAALDNYARVQQLQSNRYADVKAEKGTE
jgi:non-haem Fe2+, alpha-ketoglutarate-dependent halogenase